MNEIPSPAVTELSEFVRFYFERSGALQGYWTLYAVIIGGLLAVASMRKQPSLVTTLLVSVLFAGFAFKNLGAIRDVLTQRAAILDAIHATPAITPGDRLTARLIVPTLMQTDYAGVRNFHVGCDFLTIATLGAMEVRRRRNKNTGA